MSSLSSVNQLIAKSLEGHQDDLSVKERFQVFEHCMELGAREAAKVGGAAETVIVLGNTGVGKSVFVNWLVGKKIVVIDPSNLELALLESVVGVAPDEEEATKIGHHPARSETFLPQVVMLDDLAICDTQGFWDTRAVEITAPNALNIEMLLKTAKCVKFIFLLSSDSLSSTNRTRDLAELLQFCDKVFGSLENMVRHSKSFLLGITKVKNTEVTKKELQDFIANASLPSSKDSQVMSQALKLFSQNLFVFDPLQESPLAQPCEAVIKKIRGLKGIKKSAEFFQVFLTSNDVRGLLEICEQVHRQIKELLSVQVIDYKKVANLLSVVSELNRLNATEVIGMVRDLHTTVRCHFRSRIQECERECLDPEGNQQSKTSLRLIKQALMHFEENLREALSFSEIEATIGQFKALRGAQESVQEMVADVTEFYTQLNQRDLSSASRIFKKIENASTDFKETYRGFGILLPFDREQLVEDYHQTKSQMDLARAEKQQQSLKIRDLVTSSQALVGENRSLHSQVYLGQMQLRSKESQLEYSSAVARNAQETIAKQAAEILELKMSQISAQSTERRLNEANQELKSKVTSLESDVRSANARADYSQQQCERVIENYNRLVVQFNQLRGFAEHSEMQRQQTNQIMTFAALFGKF